MTSLIKSDEFAGFVLQRRFNERYGIQEIEQLKTEIVIAIKHAESIIKEYEDR